MKIGARFLRGLTIKPAEYRPKADFSVRQGALTALKQTLGKGFTTLKTRFPKYRLSLPLTLLAAVVLAQLPYPLGRKTEGFGDGQEV